MIQVIRLVVSPFQTWERITTAKRGFVRILFIYLLPMLIGGVALEAYSLVHWGDDRGGFEMRVKYSEEIATRYAVGQGILILASIALSALVLAWVATSFQVQNSFGNCFTLMSYGFSPIILSRYLDAVPGINTWVCLALGVFVALSVLYHGVGHALKPEQTKGFGLYVLSILLLVLSSGLSHFAAQAILLGKI
jgi:hypothetical protein